MSVVLAFRPARHGGPEGPHYIGIETALNFRAPALVYVVYSVISSSANR
jgi:hypothetical protein